MVNTIEDLEKINSYKPLPAQKRAHKAEEKFILYGGSMGSGKSCWLVNHCIFLCLKHPGIRIYLCRHEMSSFKKTTYLTLQDFLPVEFVKKENRSEGWIEFVNGSRIIYGGLGDDLRSIQKLKSMEISCFAIDEASDTQESFFNMLTTRLRQPIPGVKYTGLLVSNPCSNWIRRRFLESKLENHVFIPALPSENPYLYEGYIKDMEAALPPELFQSWIQGDWSVISDTNSLFSYSRIVDAMKRHGQKTGEVVYALDPARYGDDCSVLSKRDGTQVEIVFVKSKLPLTELSGETIRAVEKKNIPIYIDTTGVGGGVADNLRENGMWVVEFISAGRPKDEKKYKNLRAEAYFNLSQILNQLSIPNDDKLKSEMIATKYRVFSDGKLILESKDEMKKRLGQSPDRLDSIVMAVYSMRAEKGLTYDEIEARLPHTQKSSFVAEYFKQLWNKPKSIIVKSNPFKARRKRDELLERIAAKLKISVEEAKSVKIKEWGSASFNDLVAESQRGIRSVTIQSVLGNEFHKEPVGIDDRTCEEIIEADMQKAGYTRKPEEDLSEEKYFTWRKK